jgi:hypothetical protein
MIAVGALAWVCSTSPHTNDHAFHQAGLDRLLILLRPLREALQAGPLARMRQANRRS